MAVGNGTNVYGTIRYLDGRVGNPNGFDLYRIADDSVSDTNQTFVSVAADSQISPRWQTTVRFGTTNQESLYTNPTPSGIPFDPFGFGANYLGETVTLEGADGRTVTGQGILDYDGVYPSSFPSRTARQSLFGQATFQATRDLAISAGGRFEHEAGYSDPDADPTATRNNGGAFVEARATLVNRVYISAGIGVEHNEVFETAYTPRLSVAAYLRNPSTEQLGETKVTLNIGKGIKAPSVYQGQNSLYALVNGTPAGAGVDPLGPEKSRGFDVGLEQAFAASRFRARVGYFNNTFENLLEFLSRTQLVAAGVPPAVAASDGVRRLHQFRIVRCAGRRVVCRRGARRGLPLQCVVHVPRRRGDRSVRPKRRVQSGVSHDPDWRLFATRWCTAVPASNQLGHVVRRLHDRSFRCRAVRLFRRQRETTARS